MTDQQRTTETMKISDVRSQLNKLVNRVYREDTRVVVEKSGIPVVGIVSARDLERLDRLDEEREDRFRIIDEMREAFKDVSPEELEREAAKALAEVREEMRAEREQVSAQT